MISVSGLVKSFGAQTLFTDVSFRLNPGERYGLVGANGSGKTTLLSILAGDEQPSDGTVSIPKNLKLGVLRQDQFLYEDEEVLSVVLRGNRELWEAMVEKETLLARADREFDADRYARLEETFLRHDGYAAEARASEILEGLGLPTELHRQPLSTLSGGFKLRVLLAQVLAGSPDVLLLDEPTNHLDILSIRWLEKFMQEFAGSVVVISHDHRFLDNVCTHILDVDYQTVTLYRGNYSKFVDAKQAERERREKQIAKRDKEIAHHRAFVDRFRAKSSKARQAQSKLRLIEKKAESLEELPTSSRRYPTFRFEQARASGREVVKLDGIAKAFGDNQVLRAVDLTVRRGERVAIMGPNGIGKSTLLKIAVGELDPDDGEVEWGYETYPGYFAQDHREQLTSTEQSVEAAVHEVCPGETRGFVRARLGLVLFSGDEAKKRLGALSGGEAARLVFCRLAIQKPNVLVLDEPTNHLDLEAIEALVEGLNEYPGTLVFVSHDRWFVSQLATRVVEIKPGEILDFVGSYEDYVHYCGDDHLDVDTVVLEARRGRKKDRADGGEGAEASGADRTSGAGTDGGAPTGDGRPGGDRGGDDAGAGRRAKRRLSNNEIRQLAGRRDDVMAEIETAESRIREINETFADPAYYERSGPDEVRELQAELAGLQSELEELMSRWQQLEEELAVLE